jgi:hypothetical protein
VICSADKGFSKNSFLVGRIISSGVVCQRLLAGRIFLPSPCSFPRSGRSSRVALLQDIFHSACASRRSAFLGKLVRPGILGADFRPGFLGPMIVPDYSGR